MFEFFKQLFIDSFGFNHERFEELFFKNKGIYFRSYGYVDEHWKYSFNDVIMYVNELEAIVLLNDKEIFRVEFMHNMESDCENLFFHMRHLF